MRLIYDERRDPNPFFLLTGLVWGGLIEVSALGLLGSGAAPSDWHEMWPAAWQAGGVGGGLSLLLGLLVRAAAVRLAQDEFGVRRLSAWGHDRWLLRWADVRSWRLETYREASYDPDGQGGEVTRTRLVIEQGAALCPVVLDTEWHSVVAAELRAHLPALEAAEPIAAADGGAT